MAEKAYIVAELVCALGNLTQHAYHVVVRLAAVSLSADGHRLVEAEFCRNHFVQLHRLIGVAVKQFKETCRRTRGALAPQHCKRRQLEVKVRQIAHQVVEPQRSAFAARRRLRRLEMRVPECRHTFVLHGKVAHRFNKRNKAAFDKQQRFAHLYYVGVVPYVATCRAEVHNWFCVRASVAEGKQVRHYVVPYAAFVQAFLVVIDVGNVRLHFVNLRLGNIDTQLAFRLGKRNPQFAPGAVLVVGRKYVLHFCACVTLAKR